MLPNERDYFDRQQEHWVTNPFIPDRQKIRMFDDMLALSKKIGALEERKRILVSIQEEIAICRNDDGPLTKSFIAGLELLEGRINSELERRI